MKRFAKLFTRLIWGFSVVGVVLLALYVSLGRMLLPLLADYRESLQQELSATLNIPVTIAKLEGAWSGFNPALDIGVVQIGEAQRQSISAKRVLAELDVFSSLLQQAPVFRYLQVEGLQLHLVEDANGRWHLKGFNRTAGEADPKLILASLLKQPHIQFSNTTIHFMDQQGKVEVLEDIKLAFNQVSTGYRLDGFVRQAHGGQAKLIAEMQQVSTDALGQLQLYIEATPINWQPWLALVAPDDVRIEKLRLGGKLWLNWQNHQLLASGQLEGVELAAQYQDKPLQRLTKGNIRFSLNREADTNWQLLLPSVNFRFNGIAAPFNDLFVNHQQGKWTFASEQLDLNLLKDTSLSTPFLPQLPANLFKELNPRGLIQQLVVGWHPAENGIEIISKLKQVEVAAKGFAPSASGVTGLLYTTANEGWFDLNSQKGFTLGMVELFRQPWEYQKASAHLAWAKSNEQFELVAEQAQLKQRRTEYNAQLRLTFPLKQGPIKMALQAGVQNADAALAYQYIPAKHNVIPNKLVEWLDNALVAGHINQGAFLFNGPVSRTKSENDVGFGLFFNVTDGVVQYDPQWPKAEQLTGRVLVDNKQVEVNIASGAVHQANIQQLSLQVAEQRPDEFAVKVASQLKVPGTAVNHLLSNSPIGKALGNNSDNWQITGQFDSDLNLVIPVANPQKTEIVVTTQAENGTIKSTELGLTAEQISGQINYHSIKGITGDNIKLKLFGQPARLDMAAKPVKRQLQQQFRLKGKANAQQLMSWLQQQTLPNKKLNKAQQKQLKRIAKGQLGYDLVAKMPFNQPKKLQLTVKSNLKGTALNLPKPFNKTAASRQDVFVALNQSGLTDRWRVRVGRVLQSEWLFQKGQLFGADIVFGQGQPKKLKQRQIQLRGQISELDLTQWWPWAEILTQQPSSTQKRVRWQLSIDQLRLRQLRSPVGRVDNLVLNLNTYQNVWQADVESDQLAGRVVIPFDDRQKPYEIALKRLYLPSLAQNKNPQPASKIDPLANFNPLVLPNMDIEVADLKVGNQMSGSLAAKVKPAGRQLKISDISANLNHLRVKGGIDWSKQKTRFKGVVRATDLADVLKAWGHSPSITSKKAKFTVDAHWPGSPLSLSMAKLNGEVYSKIEHGRFLEVQGSANALRVFGILNFSSIARRIKLDFSDLLKSGVSFDKIKATTQFLNGIMLLKEPAKIKGPSSNFTLSGKANLIADTIDMSLLVTLPVTNNLPFLAVLMGAPQVGGAIYLFDKLLGDKVEKFASARYTLTGSLTEPSIELDKFFTDKTKQQ